MDQSLQDRIDENYRKSDRGRRRPPGRDNQLRDGIKKSYRESRTNLDNDWVHDRYDDEPKAQHKPLKNRSHWNDSYADEPAEEERTTLPAKLRVDNLHYDLTEEDLYDLFERIAPVSTVSLRYDRAGRSDGTAFVTYAKVADARIAIREFDGANAKGQPIRLTLLPIGPAGPRARPMGRKDNPFDRIENPRTLFDRIEPPKGRRGERDRSASPGDYDSYDGADSRRRGPRRVDAPPTRDRRSDVTKPAPENIDRYVPGQGSGRSSSSRNEGRESGRRPGERRERGGGSDRGRGARDRLERGERIERGENGARLVNGRPRKTQEQLDAEMEDYWGNAKSTSGDASVTAGKDAVQSAAPDMGTGADGDIDMIE